MNKFFSISALALLVSLSAQVRADGHDHDGDRDRDHNCKHFSGPFTSVAVPVPPCMSPIGMCTHGDLEGNFPAAYDFTFVTLVPAGDPNDPTKFVYAGFSVVTPKKGNGVLLTNDTGVIHIPGNGAPNPFVTTAVVATATGKWEDYTGQFVASGNLDFTTGNAVGSFTADLCKQHGRCDDDD